MKQKIILEASIDFDYLVENCLIAALEGGSNYWYWIKADENWYKIAKEYDRKDALKNNRIGDLSLTEKIAQALLNVPNFEIPIYDVEDVNEKIGLLTLPRFELGVKLCRRDYLDVYSNMITEQYDAGDADILFQLAVLGGVVYG